MAGDALSRDDVIALERDFWYRAGDVGFYLAHMLETVAMVFPAPFGGMPGQQLPEAIAEAQP